MGKGKRHQATAAEVHKAYMPHVPFKFYTNMVLGKDAPENPAEDFRVAQRIRREAELFLDAQEQRAREAEQELSKGELEALGAGRLR